MPPIAVGQTVFYLMVQCSQHVLRYWCTPSSGNPQPKGERSVAG